MKRLVASAVFVLMAFSGLGSAHAQNEITLIAPGGIKAPLDQLIPAFEKQTGRKVKATFGSGNGTKAQVAHGDPFDVPVVQVPYAEVLDSGNVIASTAKPLASVSVGVAVRHGAPKPDISTAAAVKRMLLSAKSIAYPDAAGGAAAGVSFNKTLEKLGIADQIQPKIKLAKGGAAAMNMVATGDVEIGLTFLSEMKNPDIDVVGPLPEEISTPTKLVGFISSHAKDRGAAQALLDFISSPEAAAVYKSEGMQPGR